MEINALLSNAFKGQKEKCREGNNMRMKRCWQRFRVLCRVKLIYSWDCGLCIKPFLPIFTPGLPRNQPHVSDNFTFSNGGQGKSFSRLERKSE